MKTGGTKNHWNKTKSFRKVLNRNYKNTKFQTEFFNEHHYLQFSYDKSGNLNLVIVEW